MSKGIKIDHGNMVYVNDLREDDRAEPVIKGRVLMTRIFQSEGALYIALKLETGYEIVIKGIKELEVKDE